MKRITTIALACLCATVTHAQKIKELCSSDSTRFEIGEKNYHNAKKFDYQELSLKRKKFWQKARKLTVEKL